MNCKVKILIYLLFIPTILFILVSPQIIHGQGNATINATIKISICGNNIVEGGEDCDNSDLNSKTCQNLGYGNATLTCDISCSFDTSACIAPIITITPTSTATQTQPLTLPSSTPIIPIPSRKQSYLPPNLQIFDINGVGKIQSSQLYNIVKLWVDDWKISFTQKNSRQNQTTKHKKCDINNSGACDMKDFSILMFHVEK